jgi:hypothetical protein
MNKYLNAIKYSVIVQISIWFVWSYCYTFILTVFLIQAYSLWLIMQLESLLVCYLSLCFVSVFLPVFVKGAGFVLRIFGVGCILVVWVFVFLRALSFP